MPAALITGVGRQAGIAAAVAQRLAAGGWDLGLTCWRPYDRSMAWKSSDEEPARLAAALRAREVRVGLVEADLADPEAAAHLFDQLEPLAGPFNAMVLAHTHWEPGGVLDTTPSALGARPKGGLRTAVARRTGRTAEEEDRRERTVRCVTEDRTSR